MAASQLAPRDAPDLRLPLLRRLCLGLRRRLRRRLRLTRLLRLRLRVLRAWLAACGRSVLKWRHAIFLAVTGSVNRSSWWIGRKSSCETCHTWQARKNGACGRACLAACSAALLAAPGGQLLQARALLLSLRVGARALGSPPAQGAHVCKPASISLCIHCVQRQGSRRKPCFHPGNDQPLLQARSGALL